MSFFSLFLLAFDLCKGHTNFLTKLWNNWSWQCHNWFRREFSILFCNFAFWPSTFAKATPFFWPKNHQINGQGMVPTGLEQYLVYFEAISSTQYYPCSLCNPIFHHALLKMVSAFIKLKFFVKLHATSFTNILPLNL